MAKKKAAPKGVKQDKNQPDILAPEQNKESIAHNSNIDAVVEIGSGVEDAPNTIAKVVSAKDDEIAESMISDMIIEYECIGYKLLQSSISTSNSGSYNFVSALLIFKKVDDNE